MGMHNKGTHACVLTYMYTRIDIRVYAKYERIIRVCVAQIYLSCTLYLLTSIILLITGSSLEIFKVTCFFNLKADQVLIFDWIVGSCQVTCTYLVVIKASFFQKLVNASLRLKVSQSMVNFSCTKCFYCSGFVNFETIQPQNRRPNNINRKPHWKVTKLTQIKIFSYPGLA